MYTSTSQDLIDLLALGRAGGNLDMRREVGSGVGGWRPGTEDSCHMLAGYRLDFCYHQSPEERKDLFHL